MTDPFTPTDQDDPVPPDETADETEVGAWMEDRPDEPVDTPEPEV